MTIDKNIYAFALQLVQGTQPRDGGTFPYTTNQEALTQELAEKLQSAYEEFCEDYNRE